MPNPDDPNGVHLSIVEEEHRNTGKNNGTHHLLAFVAECPAACPICDYSLRGLATPTCPECGAELELHVGSPRLRIGPWALGVVSFALALGFDGVVTVMMTLALILNPAIAWQPYGIASGFALLTALMLGGLIVLSRARREWTRRPVSTQRLWATTIFCGVGLFHAAVGMLFFKVVQ